ncbi:MAG: AAA family ATPase [Thermotogaceae bacterium]|nr:AAA family ATPase [Thermotogaceae bacterium]
MYICLMIARSHITEIGNLLSHFPVVALLGARQTGKTTLAKQIESDLGTKTIYLDLEMNSDLYKLELVGKLAK